MPSLDELLAHPERHTLAILALQEVLGGRVTGLHRSAYLASRLEALEALEASPCWWIDPHRAAAVRIDGLRLEPVMPGSPLEAGIWRLIPPGFEHGGPVGFGVRIDAASMVDATQEVDNRFPLPSWWAELDREARPWRHKQAAPSAQGEDGEP